MRWETKSSTNDAVTLVLSAKLAGTHLIQGDHSFGRFSGQVEFPGPIECPWSATRTDPGWSSRKNG